MAQRTGKGTRKVEKTLSQQKTGARERTYQQVVKGLKPGDYYADEAFIRVAPIDLEGNTDGGFFNVEASNDTNRVDLFVFGNDERMLVVARLDNLGKGASGAAVQAMNVHLGIEESLGLV